MNDSSRQATWFRLLLLLLFIMPLAVLFLTPTGGGGGGGSGGGGAVIHAHVMWFWMAMLFSVWMIWWFIGRPAEEGVAAGPPQPAAVPTEDWPEGVQAVMQVEHARTDGSVRIFRGHLKVEVEDAIEQLGGSISEATAMVQEDEDYGAAIILLPDVVAQQTLRRATFPWLNWLLFGLTIVTTTWAGAAHQDVNLLEEPGRFAVGLPYALGLMAILGFHEMGHFFVARYHGLKVTPPYFIPVPFALGTFGAFIQMKSPTTDRRALFDVAVAGPLAGLIVAIPALLIGMQQSTVVADVADAGAMGHMGGASAGSSLVLAATAKLALGDALQAGHVLKLSPLAFAGWLGLFITALNLLPVGQLDGGHISSAMFGGRVGKAISTVSLWSMFLLALFVWPGLFLWVILIFFIAGRGMPPLNDITPISPARRWLGYAAFAILLAILLPVPHALWGGLGIHCPYL